LQGTYYPMILLYLQFVFNQIPGFREYMFLPYGPMLKQFLKEDLPITLPIKFGKYESSGFIGDVKS